MRNLYITGDIHGEFESLVFYITSKYELKNSDIIVAGDVGLGFHKLNYYIQIFTKISKKLIKNNNHIYFVRGNHDDPKYYHNTPEELCKFSNIHIIDDYTILSFGDKNVLCVGGATSLDKMYRKPGIDWWAGENVNDIPEDLDYTIHQVTHVVTHTAPSIVFPDNSSVYTTDPIIIENNNKDREKLTDLYIKLIQSANIKCWYHGHYHMSNECNVPNVIYDNEIPMFKTAYFDNDKDTYDGKYCKFICLNMLMNDIDIIKVV